MGAPLGSNMEIVQRGQERQDDGQTHWATLTGERLASAMLDRFKRFEDALKQRDFDRMLVAYTTYYGADEQGHESHRVSRSGRQNQIRHVIDNEFRAVLDERISIATAEPGTFNPVPKNSDSDTQRAAMLARGLLDYVFEEGGAEKKCKQAVTMSRVLIWAWVDVWWDDNAGPDVDELGSGEAPPPAEGVDPNAPAPPAPAKLLQRKAGEAKSDVMMPTDVAFEYDTRSGELQWVELRKWRNKFDLAAEVEARIPMAQTPEEAQRLADMAKRIRGFMGSSREDQLSWEIRGWTGETARGQSKNDEVAVFELRHLPTPGCPGGRWARVLDSTLILDEGPCRYFDSSGTGDLGCYRVMADVRFGTPRGYSPSHDNLGLQKVVDTMTSIAHSNLAALGLTVLAAPEGSSVRPEDVREGLVMAYYKGTKDENLPEPLQLAKLPAELPEFRAAVKGDMAAKEGLRGSQEAASAPQLSGSARVLMDTSTQRAVSPTAQAYTELRAAVATGYLRRYQQFAETARNLSLKVGKTKRVTLGSISKAGLAGIDRVTVETLSAVMRSQAGRQEAAVLVADSVQKGVPPEVMLTLMSTGQYEPHFESKMGAVLTIREENERMLQGEMLETPREIGPDGQPLPTPPGVEPIATALWTDNHLDHIREHQAVTQSVASRRNPAVMDAHLGHHMKHVEFLMEWVSGSPRMVSYHGPPPPEAFARAGVMPGAPGQGPDGGAVRPDGGPKPSGEVPGQQPRAPSAPSNPNTGESWTPTGAVANG